MKLKKYRKEAHRTVNKDLSREALEENLLWGLAGEAGEVIDLIKKVVYHGHDADRDTLRGELGDVCWYIAGLLDLHKIPDNEVSCYLDGSWARTWDFSLDLRYACNKLIQASALVQTGGGTYVRRNLTDCLISIEQISALYDLTLSDVFEANVDKLRERYPSGFSSERSINREKQ